VAWGQRCVLSQLLTAERPLTGVEKASFLLTAQMLHLLKAMPSLNLHIALSPIVDSNCLAG
jgi:hypothetical protein